MLWAHISIQKKQKLWLKGFSGDSDSKKKNLPATLKTQVQSLGQEDPMEKEMAIHSSIIAWRISWAEKPDRLEATGLQKVSWTWPSD